MYILVACDGESEVRLVLSEQAWRRMQYEAIAGAIRASWELEGEPSPLVEDWE